MLRGCVEPGVQSKDGFAITGCCERVGGVGRPKFSMVVDLAVYDQDASVNPNHGLATGGKVNDGEAGVGKSYMFVQPNIVCIWATMLLQTVHALEDGFIRVSEHATDTAHDMRTGIPFLKRCSLSAMKNHQRGYLTMVTARRRMAKPKPTWYAICGGSFEGASSAMLFTEMNHKNPPFEHIEPYNSKAMT